MRTKMATMNQQVNGKFLNLFVPLFSFHQSACLSAARLIDNEDDGDGDGDDGG